MNCGLGNELRMHYLELEIVCEEGSEMHTSYKSE